MKVFALILLAVAVVGFTQAQIPPPSCAYILAQTLINPCECDCADGPIKEPTVAYVLQPINLTTCSCECDPVGSDIRAPNVRSSSARAKVQRK